MNDINSISISGTVITFYHTHGTNQKTQPSENPT